MRRRNVVVSGAIAAFLAIPGAVVAQACVGIPVADAHNAVTAEVGFPQDAMSYGASFRHNMAGPFSFAAGYTLASYDNVDPKQHGLTAEVDYELPSLGFSACPTVGLGYSMMSEDPVSVNTLSIPVGVGLGKSFPVSPGMAITPYVVPQWQWAQVTIDDGTDSISADDSWLAAQLGATFSTPRFYVGGGVLWINEDNVDPVFSIRAGMPF